MLHPSIRWAVLAALAGALGLEAEARPALPSVGPRADALKEWSSYEASVDRRHSAAPPGGPGFFALDAIADSDGWRAAARRGEVAVARVESPAVPGAAIHHWLGAIFVPGATLDAVFERLQAQAGTEQRLYEDVLASKLLARDGPRLRVFLKLRRTTVITVVYNTEHLVEYRRLGPARAASRSVATRIAEVADAGTPSEHEKPEGTDHGFLWRMDAFWRYEQVDGGVFVECESLSLSRSVPALARPIASPIVNRVARESLARTLRGLKKALGSGL